MDKTISLLKKTKVFIFRNWMIVIFVLICGITFTFFINIGINQKYFLEKDLEKAMKYRLAGDCESFSKYVVSGESSEWTGWCLKEKDESDYSIDSFSIGEVSVSNNKAFARVNLQKRHYKVIANYELESDAGPIYHWRLTDKNYWK